MLIGRTLLALRQIKNGRNILTSILSHSGDPVQGQAFRFLVENIISSIADEVAQGRQGSDEVYDEIEELENLVSILEDPTPQILKEFGIIEKRNGQKLKVFVYTALQHKQMRFLKYLAAFSEK